MEYGTEEWRRNEFENWTHMGSNSSLSLLVVCVNSFFLENDHGVILLSSSWLMVSTTWPGTNSPAFITEEEKRKGNRGSRSRTSVMSQKKVLLFWLCAIIMLDGRETGGLSTEFMEY